MRYLAIDLGDKRTGLALGDDSTRLASPWSVIEIPRDQRQGQDLLDAIARAALDSLGPPGSPGELVLGLPLNMDSTEGPRAKLVRAFAARLESLGRRVHLHDERLTSADADWSLARSGLTHHQKKNRRDAIAAAAMLHDFLAQLPRHAPGNDAD